MARSWGRRSPRLLVMGTNLPAVDATAARLMGINPWRIEYLAGASGRLGPIAEDHIEQRGEAIAALVHRSGCSITLRGTPDLIVRSDQGLQFQVADTPGRVAAHRVGPGHGAAGEPDTVVREAAIGLGIVGADELRSLASALSRIVVSLDRAWRGIDVGPGPHEEAISDELLDAIEVLDRVVDLEPGRRGMLGCRPW